MKKKLLLIFILLIISPALLIAGTGAASFLNIGAGARALGMGGAFTAVADDATASFWNPAGLGLLEDYQSAMMLQRLSSADWPGMEDIAPSYQFYNIILPCRKIGLLRKGALGFSVLRYEVTDVPHTYLENGSIVRNSFNDTESAYYISFGYPAAGRSVLVGGNFKYISQNFSSISGASAWGWDLEAGILLSITGNVKVGFLAAKGPELHWENEHVDRDFLKTKVGASYKYMMSEKTDLTGAVDLLQSKDMPLTGSAGLEFAYRPEIDGVARIDSVAARTGISKFALENRYDNIDQLNKQLNWNIGFGANVGVSKLDLQIDYAFSSLRLGANHRISVIVKIL